MRFPSLNAFRPKQTERRTGDAHRNAGEWALAADAYRRHLADRPDDAAIWVQLGHVEKEDRRPAEAEAAYREAIRIAPADPDPLLHLGHLLKTRARFDEAFETFLALFRLAATPESMTELAQLQRGRRHRARTAREGAVLFSMQDIFNMFAAHATTTGIQRVQAGVARAAMDDPGFDAHFIVNGEHEDEVPTFLRLEEDALRAILDYAAGDRVDHEVLRQMAGVARLTATPITFGAGTTVVILGSFWGIGNGIDQYLKERRQGVRIIPFVHDIIPLTHPHFCDANLSNFFWRGLAELLHAADHVLTNSDYTQAELKRFLAEQGGRALPMTTVPLAHSMARPGETRTMWPRALARLKGGRYVAYVSTIEGRKNHIFVVRAWQEMIARGVDVPDLVFVGREGWRVDPLLALLDETGHLGGRVHIVHGLSDAELNGVYAHAMFTVFTSVVEGWGLPVGESLTHGVPCVVARTASLPEVGGDFVDYVDPDDPDAAVAVLRRMIEDDGYRAARRRNIAQHFVPRTWEDVGRDAIAKLRAIIAGAPAPAVLPPVTLPEADVFRPGEITKRVTPVPGYVSNPLGLALIDGFYEPEGWGAWLRGRSGELTFQTTVAPGETIVVLMAVRPAPWAERERCAFAMNGVGTGPRRWLTLLPGDNFVRLKGRVAQDGAVAIRFDYAGGFAPKPEPGDERRFALGLSAIGYVRADRPQTRSALREALLFG